MFVLFRRSEFDLFSVDWNWKPLMYWILVVFCSVLFFCFVLFFLQALWKGKENHGCSEGLWYWRPTLGSIHIHGPSQTLFQHHWLPHCSATWLQTRWSQSVSGELQVKKQTDLMRWSLCFSFCFLLSVTSSLPQSWLYSSRHNRGAATLCQEAVWLGISPRHGWQDEPDRKNVISGAWGYGHHRVHASVLQVSTINYETVFFFKKMYSFFIIIYNNIILCMIYYNNQLFCYGHVGQFLQ